MSRLNRTANDPNHSFLTFGDRQFYIEPEYLTFDELQYELRIRGLPATGDRRNLTLALRASLNRELDSTSPQPMLRVHNPSVEINYVRGNIPRLRTLLAEITRDMQTHARFMTLLLHLEGRAERIEIKNGADESLMRFESLEALSSIYHEFIARVRSLEEQRRRPRAPHDPAILEIGQLFNNENRVEQGDGEQESEQDRNNLSQMGAHGGQQPQNESAERDRAVSPEALRLQMSVKRVSGPGARIATPNTEREQPPTINDVQNESGNVNNNVRQQIPIYRDQTGGTNQTNSQVNLREEASRNGILEPNHAAVNGVHIPNLLNLDSNSHDFNFSSLTLQGNGNGTVNSNDNVRPSHNFNRPAENPITPINLVNRTNQNPIFNFDIPARNAIEASVGAITSSESYPNRNQPQVEQANFVNYEFGANQAHGLPQTVGFIPNQGVVRRTRVSEPYRHVPVALAPGSNSYVEQRAPNVTYNPSVRHSWHSQHFQQPPSAQMPNATYTIYPPSSEPIPMMHDMMAAIHQLTLNMQSMQTEMTNMNARMNASQVSQNTVQPPVSVQNTTPVTQSQTIPTNTSNVPTNVSQNSQGQSTSVQNESPQNRSAHTHAPVSSTTNVRRAAEVPIHKWGIKFTADASSTIPERKSLTAFLKKLEVFRQSENLPKEEVFRKFHYLVEGAAQDWYLQNRTRFTDWEQLENGLKTHFITELEHLQKLSMLNLCRQKFDENVQTYISRVTHECDELDVPTSTRIGVIMNGLKPELRAVAQARQYESVLELDQHVRGLEVSNRLRQQTDVQIQSERQKKQFFPRRRVNICEARSSDSEDMSEKTRETSESEDSESSLYRNIMTLMKKRNHPIRNVNGKGPKFKSKFKKQPERHMNPNNYAKTAHEPNDLNEAQPISAHATSRPTNDENIRCFNLDWPSIPLL